MIKKRIYLNGIESRYSICTNVYNEDTKQFMAGGKDKNGYHIVSLSLNGKKYTRKIHRLVALAFIPNPENKSEVNHKDGDKWNNDVSNLEWVTPLENTRHACNNNIRYSVLTEETVVKICEILEKGDVRISNIARLFNIKSEHVCKIKRGLIWKDIVSKYDFSNYKSTRSLIGEENNRSQYSNHKIEQVCRYIKEGFDTKTISRVLNVSENVIRQIKTKKTWKHISDKYF